MDGILSQQATQFITGIGRLFKSRIALENAFLRQENKILRSKLGKTPPQTPMCNAYAERFVREARETLNDIIPLGERHFRHVLKCIEKHHNHQRPHQGIDNLVPLGYDYPKKPAHPKNVCRESLLGGLLNHYYVKKAA